MTPIFSTAKIIGAPPFKSIDIPASSTPSHFDLVIGEDKTLFISYINGVKIFDGSQWQDLEILKNSAIRTLLLDDDRIYLGGSQIIGFLDKDEFGQYHFTNMTPDHEDFESIWDIIKCNNNIYFRSVYQIFEFSPKNSHLESWKFDSKLGSLLCHNNQVTLQDRSIGFKKLVHNQWQDSELQVPNNPFVFELNLIDENTYFILSGNEKWRLLKNNSIINLDFDKQLPSLSNYVSSASLSKGKLVLGSNNGLLTFVDTLTQTAESFQLTNQWIAKIIVTNNHEIVVLTEFEVFYLQWPSPLRIQNKESGLSSDLHHINQWNNKNFVLSSAGVFVEDKDQVIYQHKLFKRLDWTNQEAWWLLPLNENNALLAESHQIFSVDKDNNAHSISDTIYPRELIQSLSNPNLVYVITEFDVRTFMRKNDGEWESKIIYNHRPISLIETSTGEVLLSSIDEGVVKIEINQQGEQKLTMDLNAQLGLSINEENAFSLTKFSDGEVYAFKSNEIYRLKNNKLIKDSLNGLDDILGSESLIKLKQNSLGEIYAISQSSFYHQNKQKQWAEISLSPYIKGTIHDFYIIDDEIKITSYGTLVNYLNIHNLENQQEEYKLSLKSIEFSTKNSQKLLPLDGTEPITYEQNSGDLSFSFALNDMKNHKDTLYRYRINGLNDKWSEYSNLTRINVSHLKANTYTLEVQAKTNLNQIYSLKPIKIIINPPWYLTKLAIASWLVLCLLLLLIVLHSILKWRERIHEIQKVELKKIINHKTQELKNANKKLKRMAHHDGLTGLSNRLYLDEFIKTIVNSDIANISVLMLDMDYFKKYNDQFGHLAGDELLKKLAALLTQEIVEDDHSIVARYGGEEFVVIILNKALEYVKQKAETIRQSIENKNQNVSVSIGISHSKNQSDLKTIDAIYHLIDSADQLLYQAKNSGRNKICSS